MLKNIVVVILLVAIMVNIAYRLDHTEHQKNDEDELMYFPSGYGIKVLSFGHQALLADMVWLQFIQYYGKHRLTDRVFTYMYHMLDILTTLNPNFLRAYLLGSLLLTHDAQHPEQAKKLLKKGMHHNPHTWVLPFYYGFIHFVFVRDYATAQSYFVLAAHKPGAPDLPKRWAAFVTYKKLRDLETALALWLDLYNTTQNPVEQEIAALYIKDIQSQIDIDHLNEKLEVFKNKYNRSPMDLEELVRYGILDSIPHEPHGATYTIEKGKAVSTHKHDIMMWKKARQGE